MEHRMDAGERGGMNPAVKDGEKREVGVLRTEQVEANRGCWEI